MPKKSGKSASFEAIRDTLPIKSFCIDMNWDFLWRQASPGLYAHANPREHVKWLRDLGANVIQTFCVSYNGYAWYPSKVAPVTPGLKRNFLQEQCELGHKHGMRVMGYFCLGNNLVWESHHQDEGHFETRFTTYRTPFTRGYLEYFCKCVREALKVTDIDGFMIDWFRPIKRGKWLDCEKVMFKELMGQKWPASGDPDADTIIEFERRMLQRAWEMIKGTVEDTRRVVIWTNHPFDRADDPIWNGHKLLKEVDWVLNEAPKPEFLAWLEKQIGPQTKIIQNLCGWLDHDAMGIIRKLDRTRFGWYGFAMSDPATTLPATSGVSVAKSNTKNIAQLRKFYHTF